MKDQQLSSEPAQTSDTTPEAAPAEGHRLPPEVYHQVVRVPPGDAEALADLLEKYPAMQQQILAVASSHAGAATVRQAIELRRQIGHVLVSDELRASTREIAGDETYKKPVAKEQTPAEKAPQAPVSESAPVAAPVSTPSHAEPAWVAPARKYNAAHSTLVDEFNYATDFATCLDDGKQPDPIRVADWQRQRGLTPDGMIGPHTVAAARAELAKSRAKPSQAEARLDV